MPFPVSLSEDPSLRIAAEVAVIQWRYQPATLDGKPIQTNAVTVDITFFSEELTLGILAFSRGWGTCLDRKFHARGCEVRRSVGGSSQVRGCSLFVGSRRPELSRRRENHRVRCRYWQGHCCGAVRAAAMDAILGRAITGWDGARGGRQHFATVSFAAGIAEISTGEPFVTITNHIGILDEMSSRLRRELCQSSLP
jgi:hypothetical protein